MSNSTDRSAALIRGSFWSYLGIGLVLAFGFVTNIALARLLNKEAWGILSAVIAFVSLLTTLTDLGLNYTILYKTSRASEKGADAVKKAIGFLLRYKLMIIFVIGALMALAADPISGLFNIENGSQYFLAAAVFYILYNILGSFDFIVTGLKFFKESSYVSTVHTVLRLVFAYGLVVLGFGINGAIVGFILALAIAVLVQVYVLRKFLSFSGKTSESMKSLFSYGFYFGLAGLASGIMLWTDSVTLGIMVGATAVGFYKISISISSAIGGLIGVVSKVVFPIFSSAEASGQDTTKDFNKALRYAGFFAFPAAVGLAMSSDLLINVFFGTQYSPGIPALVVLSYLAVDMIFNGLLISFLAAKNKIRIVGEISAAGAIVNLFLNIGLISMFGLIGAAIASVISRFGVLVFLVVWTKKNLKLNFDFGQFIIPLIGSAVMAIVLYFVRPIILQPQTVIGTVIYIGLGIVVYLITTHSLGFDFVTVAKKAYRLLTKK